MQPITSDLSSILQLNQFALQVSAPNVNPAQTQVETVSPKPISGDIDQKLLDDIAVMSSPNMTNAGMPFDIAMNDIASYKDVISQAQAGISAMRTKGQDIKDIIAQAQQGNLSQELIDKLQAEVDEKILDISIIKDAAEKDGTNIYDSPYGINIQDIESMTGTGGSDFMAQITGGMTSYDLDLSFSVDGINFDGSAKISMGTDSNGVFQFAFDVSLDYDLSGIAGEGGITSAGAPDIIDNFMNMLDSKDGILSKASKIVDSAFEKIFNAVNPSVPDNFSSSYLSKQILQQSSSIFDSINMNQLPGMALNLI